MADTQINTEQPKTGDVFNLLPENQFANGPMRHQQYLAHLDKHFASGSDKLDFMLKLQHYEKEIQIMKNLDLDAAIPILISLYSPGKIKDAWDPPCMLRSLLLMTLLRVKGVTAWVKRTKQEPFLAVLIGSEPGCVPGIGTYYDFMKRLIDGPWRKPCQREEQVKRSEYNAQPHKRNLKNEKQALKNDFDPNHSQSEKLAEKLLANTKEPRAKNLYQILEDLHIQLGVIPSIQQGLITDLQALVVSGDGSILETAASSSGKPTCNCRSQGIYKCDCDRYYTSPTAKWCYEHVHDVYIFGDRYYHLVTTQAGHDYPLLTCMFGGNESDYTLSLTAFDRLEKALRENHLNIAIAAFIGDGHHDSYAHYHFFGEKNVLPIIPLSKPSQKAYPHLSDDSDIRLDMDGVPLCPSGIRMRHHCYEKKDSKHVYSCPAKRNTHRDGKSEYVFHEDECPGQQNCDTKSSLGPFVYLRSSTDPRLFPPLPRTSPKFKELMNQRSASERCNFINDSYCVEGASRNADYSLIRLTLANIAHHSVIRYEELKKQRSDKDAQMPSTDGVFAEAPYALQASS